MGIYRIYMISWEIYSDTDWLYHGRDRSDMIGYI